MHDTDSRRRISMLEIIHSGSTVAPEKMKMPVRFGLETPDSFLSDTTDNRISCASTLRKTLVAPFAG